MGGGVKDLAKNFEALSEQNKLDGEKLKAKSYVGHAHVKEGTIIRLTAKATGTKPKGAPQWEITDGSKGATETKPATFGGAPVPYTLAKVPDDKPSYDFNYKLTFEGGNKPGICEFTVWPATLDVAATYKNKAGEPAHPTFKDGDLVKAFQLKVVQDGGALVTREHRTDKDGACQVDLPSASAAVVSAVSPWEIVTPTDQAAGTRKRALEVSCKTWKAKLRSHAEGRDEKKPLKQYVNLEDGGASLVKIEVGPEDLSLAKTDQEVKVRVTFPKENQKVEDPLPALWKGTDKATAVTVTPSTAKPGVNELKYEAVVKIPADGAPAVFYVQLGVCGGDRCKIEVGVTDTYEDDELHFENWRKIALELLYPKKDHRQKCDALLKYDDATPRLGDDLSKALVSIFDGTFIELEEEATGCKTFDKTGMGQFIEGKGPGLGFNWKDIAKPEHLFVDAAKVCDYKRPVEITAGVLQKRALGGGDKVFVCSDYQRRDVRKKVLAAAVKKKHVMTWVWMDYISSRATDNKSQHATGNWDKWDEDQKKVFNTLLVNLEGKDTTKVIVPFHVFDYDPLSADGTLGFKYLFWRAFFYRKKGDPDWVQIDPVPASCPCPACVQLKGEGKPVVHSTPRPNPGAAYGWTQVTFTSLAEVNQWVTITDSMNIVAKLPKRATPTAPALAGDLLTIKVSEDHVKSDGTGTEKKDVEYELSMLVELHMYGVKFATLGGAVGGEGDLRTTGGLSPAQGMANVVAHEIAHNCGQTYVLSDGSTVGGRAVGPITGVPWGKKVPDGPYYVGHGHQGSHCIKPVFDKITVEADKTTCLVRATGASQDVMYHQRSGDHWDKYFSKVSDEDHCIMFGEADADSAKTRKFCDLCKGYLRVTDLSNVTKGW